MNTEQVIIIGGGVAGMTAGIALLEQGYRVTVLERQKEPGGNLTAWEREGHTVDNCLHWLNGTKRGSSLYALWERIGALGGEIGIRRLERLYTSQRNGQSLSLWRDPERLRREMYTLSPKDREATDRFIGDVKTLANGNPIAKAGVILRNMRYSLSAYADGFHHPLLRSFFTDYIGGEYAALGLFFVYASFLSGNADLPAGGSREMAQRIAERFRSLGGKLITSCRVTDILLDGKNAVGVLTANGVAYPADAVIAACDPHVTFGKLLPRHLMPHRLLSADRDPRMPTASAIHAAFSVAASDCPVSGTVIFDAPRTRFSIRSRGRMSIRVFDHEPGFAPEGRLVIQVLLFVDGAESDHWIALAKDRDAYRAEKEAFARYAEAAILAQFPTLSSSLTLLDVWTPATYKRWTGAYRGDFIGYVMTGGTAPYRIPARVRGLRNVYLASGWCRMPSGLPSAARAGEAAAKRLLLDRAILSLASPLRKREATEKSGEGY